ncbi:hypothetical protein H8E50_10300 [bacterium]|nr:hypothetical protein [bacterium]
MKKKVFTLLTAAMFAGGMLFYGADNLYAQAAEDTGEEFIYESAQDMEELDAAVEEELRLERLEQEQYYQDEGAREDEDPNYRDDEYQHEKG